MKVVIMPNSFKENLGTEKCCQAIRAEFSALFPDAHYICLPITGGGEETVGAMVTATGGSIVKLKVYEPMDEKVKAFYGVTGDGKTAVIETAATSGLILVVPEKHNPLLASSFDTGELVHHALDNGIRHIILSIGGSTTVNGGMGMTQALGICFLDADDQALAASGDNLARMAGIEMNECDPRLANCHIKVACDADDPLVRARDAAAVFGPQKGTTPEMVEELEQGLQNYARVSQQMTEINIYQMAGGDAAGGIGIAAAVFLNANIKSGIEIVSNTVNLAQTMQDAALVAIGGGHIDSQTAGDEASLGVASVVKQFNVPMIGIADVLGDGVEVVHQYGIDTVFSILPHLAPLAEVLASGETNLFDSVRNIACTVKISQRIKN